MNTYGRIVMKLIPKNPVGMTAWENIYLIPISSSLWDYP